MRSDRPQLPLRQNVELCTFNLLSPLSPSVINFDKVGINCITKNENINTQNNYLIENNNAVNSTSAKDTRLYASDCNLSTITTTQVPSSSSASSTSSSSFGVLFRETKGQLSNLFDNFTQVNLFIFLAFF